jgi:hypothetical protein
MEDATNRVVRPVNTHRRRATIRECARDNRQALENAKSAGDFWTLLKEFSDGKRRTAEFGVDELAEVCVARMTAPQPMPPSFCTTSLASAERSYASLPSSSLDRTPERFFSEPWSQEEITSLMLRIAEKPYNSSTGFDGKEMGYSLVLRIPSEQLGRLFNECVALRATPQIWLTTILVGIQKPGKPRVDLTS